MVKLEYYLEDGACMQAQCVLAYLKAYHEDLLTNSWNKERGRYEATCWVGRYENGREQGYVFTCTYKGEQLNFAVYEHRNSDNLCVVKFNGFTMNTPTMEDVTGRMKDKWDVTKKFGYMQIERCCKWILNEIENFIVELNEKEETSNEK